MKKILSIIVPSYNVEKYIHKTVESMISEDLLEKIEIILVNDGSKDSTLEILNSWGKKYPSCVKVINKENGGHGSVINEGVKYATGKYFKVVDGDDWLNTDGLCKLIKALEKINVDVVLSSYSIVEDGTYRVLKRKSVAFPQNKKFDLNDHIFEFNDFWGIHSLTYNLNTYKEGNYNLREQCFYEDQEYNLFPLTKITTGIYFDFDVYRYRLGRSDQSVAMKNKIAKRNMQLMIIDDLIDFERKNSLSPRLWEFYQKHVAMLVNVVCGIYFSMPFGISTYKELLNFQRKIKETNVTPFLYNYGRFWFRFPFMYWALSPFYKITNMKPLGN